MVDHPRHSIGRRAAGQGEAADDTAPVGERIAKVLARAGVASRREVERLIEAGRVQVNGVALTTQGRKILPTDVVVVDGAPVQAAEAARLFRYHKPTGLVTTHRDPAGRPTVFSALPADLPRLISIGRLDLTSEGLLLLTNDGALARALELPSSGFVRRYRARARGRIDQGRLEGLKAGITVDGIRYGPIEARLDKVKGESEAANLWISLTLAEGKNREVRRVLEALGLTVNRLIRLAYGPFALGDLAVGGVEEVGPRVLREQLASFIPPSSLPAGDRPLYRSLSPAGTPSGQTPRRKAATVPEPPPEPTRKSYKPGWARPKPARAKAASVSAGAAPRPPRRSGAAKGSGARPLR
ncbi:MAG: pseudouridine synthase [Caulobacteraceae bacterium]